MRVTRFASVVGAIAGMGLCAAVYASSISIYQSGFNADEVFGIHDDPNNGSNSAVTGDVDQAASYWTGAGYSDGSTTVSAGLPTGLFTSATGSGIQYQFQSFSGTNNALRLVSGTGSVNVTPGTYTQLSFLGTGGSGNGTSNVTLNFAGGITYTANGALVAGDWGNGGNVAVAAQRTRPNGAAPLGSITGGTWNVFESILAVPALYQNDTLQSVSFTDTGNGVANVYAVNGLANVPEPASLGLLGMCAAGLLARRRRA